MGKQCIYCGTTNDLSKSDIIPDALTNAKIINSNVCRVEHNNKFSDLFEDEVIKKLALITNELDIKSSKSKNYAPYSAQINVNGKEYSTNISTETELFRSKKMRSLDGKYLIGPIDEIKKIKTANDNNVTQIDVTQIEIEKKVNIHLAIFFSNSMYRIIAKIAFEWYCAKNSVNVKLEAFESVVQYITTGIGNNIVSIIGNEELYNTIKMITNHGSHTIISYVGKDNSVNIMVSLFGIAIYNVKLLDSIIDECKNNVIFQELTIDAKRIQFKTDTFENFAQDLHDKLIAPVNMENYFMTHRFFYVGNFSLFQEDLQCVIEPNEKIINLILMQVEDVLQSSAITLRGIKRFVKEHYKSFDEKIQLNPRGTNKKAVVMFYILFIIGQSKDAILNINDLNKVLKAKFSGETISINDEMTGRLRNEIFSTVDYEDIIFEGAKFVDSWNYD